MHDDDRPVGRRLSRRELVGLFGASVAAVAATSRARDAGGAAIAGAALPQGASLAAQDCIALPQQTEGPYFRRGAPRAVGHPRRSIHGCGLRAEFRSTCVS